jgi:hypothetical protein
MYIISHYFNISETICILRQCNGILLISRTGTTHACFEVNIAVLNLDIAMILLNSMIYSYNYNFNESLDFPYYYPKMTSQGLKLGSRIRVRVSIRI